MKLFPTLTRRSRALIMVAATAAVVAPLATFSVPASAYQGVPPPTPQTFAQCPTKAKVIGAKNRNVTVCLVGTAAQGTIDIGSLDTTFRGPGVVDGGVNLGLASDGTFNWANALNGKSFTSPRQLLGVPVMVALGNPSGVTPPANSDVYVQAVAVGQVLFGVNDGLVTQVPLAFHLENALLGNDCWLGSAADPITLNLTTGTSGALTGGLGSLNILDSGNVIQTIGTEVVDNTFTVPGATGCGSGGVFDQDIDAAQGLPNASGANEAILYGNFDLAAVKWVRQGLK
jgi:hypothetical protein